MKHNTRASVLVFLGICCIWPLTSFANDTNKPQSSDDILFLDIPPVIAASRREQLASEAGQIYQHVPEAQIAWHAGIPAPYVWADNTKNQWPGSNPNAYSIGIEHEGYDDGQPWPDAQVHASAALVAWICARYAIPIDRAHVVGHHEIYSGHSCPGAACPVDGIVDLATASTSVAARRW